MAYLFIFLTPLLNFLLFELFFFRPGFFYAALLASNLLIVLAVWRVTGRKIASLEFWNFCIFPVIFSSSLAAYSLLLTSRYLIQILFAADLILIFFYLKNVYRGERSEFLENISSYGNLLSIFFCFSIAYGLSAFVNMPVWLLILALIVVIALVIYQIIWANKVRLELGAAYIFLSCLILAQIAWAVYFLPFNYNALGLIMAIFYYLSIGLIKSYFGGKLASRYLKLYLFSGLGGLALILLTAKWA